MHALLLSLLALPLPQDDKLAWVPSLQEGYVQARKLKQPVLLRVSGEGCPWCEKLEIEFGKAEVMKELAEWTLVSLDVSKDERELKPLAVQGIPALRILTAYGGVVATQDGYVPAEKLLAWLKEHRPAAAKALPKEFVEEEEITTATAVKLVEAFKGREAIFREAAIRRLLPYPEAAAHPVVEAAAGGNLQARLAAFELLHAWKAPVEGLDPWQAETLTEAKIKALRAWAASPNKKMDRPRELARDLLPTVRQDLEALLRANDVEAMGIYERLARHGAALLPEVYAQLKTARTDQQKERLTQLRYRLVSTDALALQWPDGLRRLAATSSAVRHQAVQELAARASPAEEPLLLELFSDPDGLVRELSLRALHGLSGSKVTASLTRLLADPEPNVRAAVLKELAEKPSAEVVATIKEYIAREKDADLVVHAVRVLRQTKSKSGAEALRGLFTHDSWRVRAEAAEGVSELLKEHTQLLDSEGRADVYAALIELLQDSDSFVVSRATLGLKSANLLAAVEPLKAAAEKHPELAADIIDTLAAGGNMRSKALEYVRKSTTNPREPIRVAAIKALGSYELEESEKEIKAALKDTGPVKTAACRVIFQKLTASSNRPRMVHDDGSSDENANADDYVKRLRERKSAPEWFKDVPAVVKPMLEASSNEEQLAAALLLLAFGEEDRTVPRIVRLAKDKPALLGEASEALVCLAWDKKLKLFNDLMTVPAADEQLGEILECLVRVPDKRMKEVLWDFAGSPRFSLELLSHLYQTLLPMHFSGNYYDTERLTEKQKKAAATFLRPYTEKGPELRQSLALALLYHSGAEAAGEVADELLKDPATPAGLRRDALVIQLLALPKAKAREQAIAGLKTTEEAVKKLSLIYLATDGTQLGGLRGNRLYLYNTRAMPAFARTSGEPIAVEPPKGVTAQMVKPLLTDNDAKIRGLAGYVLCTLGDRGGLPVVVKYWNDHARTDEEWQRLVYRAVSALGDDANVRYAEEIYLLNRDPQRQYYVPELYWTIRNLEGPNALRLRKQIRQEVGMDRLR